MATRNKGKLAAMNKENCEANSRSNLAQNSGAPRLQEDYITQVSEEIEGRVTKRLSKEFSRTENRILGALARLDDFLMNSLLPGHSGTAPESTRNVFGDKQGTNEDDDSQNDPHPEAGLFHGQTTRNAGPEDGHDMVTGVQRERESAATTWWQEKQNKIQIATTWPELTKKSCTVPLVHLWESKRIIDLTVNRNSAVKIPLRRSRQTKFC